MGTSLLRQVKDGILHLLYPRVCEGCSKPLLAGEEVLCISCVLQLPATGYHHIPDNETATRFAGRIPFAHATSYAYFTHNGLLQHLLHRLKYKDKYEIGAFLGRQFAQSLAHATWIQDVDLVLPVPLHPSKKASRGYNQSMLIAQGLGTPLGIPAADNVLLRTRKTDSQTRKTRAERVDNMANAFSVREGAGLAGRHVLICDDVLTTGATIEACALALQHIEGIKISIATIGIAVA